MASLSTKERAANSLQNRAQAISSTDCKTPVPSSIQAVRAAVPVQGDGGLNAAVKRLYQLHHTRFTSRYAPCRVILCQTASYSGFILLISALEISEKHDSEKVRTKQQRQLSSWRSAKCFWRIPEKVPQRCWVSGTQLRENPFY